MTYEEAEALIREHMDYGGNVKVAALAKALSTSTLTFHQAAVAALEAATKSLNAAGASEGQAEPVAWLHTMHMEFGQTDERLSFSDQNPWGEPGRNYSEEYAVVSKPLVHLAELTALRERVAGIRMEALKEARHVVYMALSLNDAFKSIEALVDKELKQ